MKKEKVIFTAFVMLMVFSFCIVQVLAEGKVYKLELETGHLTLQESDVIEFKWNEKTNRIMLREVDEENQNIKITVFIEDAETPVYSSLSKEAYNKIDFDKDGKTDLVLKFVGIKGKDATIYIEIPKQDETIKVSEGTSINLKGILITLGVIIIGVLIYLLFRKK